MVDAVPARRDEVDEQRQIIDASMPLGEEVVLEPLQAADRLPGETTNLCQLTADRRSLGADTLANGVFDPARERRLELRGKRGERLDLCAGPFESRVDVALRGASFGGLLEPLFCPCHRCFVHGRER